MRLRVLGVDPAAAGLTGYGIVETNGRDYRALRFGVLRPARQAGRCGEPARTMAGEPAARLREVHRLIAQLLEKFSPDAVAIEGVFTALNMKTALRLAEVHGVVMLAAAQGNVPVHSYSPREVKSSVVGYGQAGKAQMQQMVRALLRLREIPEPADAADALAVALCHIHACQSRRRIAAATAAPHPAPNSRTPRADLPTYRSAEPACGPSTRLRASRIQPVR